MSKQVDQRVVEMRFDNQHFEKNVSTTMSTLDKLKQKLNFSGASKGLENLGASAKKIDMSGLAQGVQAVHNKFSALEVMGVTALANITNSAVNAGKRIVRSLTIDPVRTGWNEYELKMGSIQTIMASTGESLESVNKYLNELNEYSDKTIYSFSDMTSNIGKFTNAGVKLEDAVLAMKGISNEAALSGANANEASRAMYNFAQALSAGYVKLIDWKSIELANMATKGFKDELIKSAVAAGTLVQVGDDLYQTLGGTVMNATQNFNDSLKDEWMTTEVLIGTLKDYADETTEIGKKATQAATEVKTFSQMLDALKESAQSGWAQTWEIIFGDFEEGKTLWTNINNVVGGMLDKITKVRNAFTKKVFGSKWSQLGDEIEKAGLSMDDFEKALRKVGGDHVESMVKEYGSLAKAMDKGRISSSLVRKALQKLTGAQDEHVESTEEMTESLSDYQSIADKVMDGIFGNGAVRVEKLTEAGYDWAYVQNIVNERLGSSVRHFTTLTEEQVKNADSLVNLTDEQLAFNGMTEEQITALRDLQNVAADATGGINDLINSIEKPSGRTLVIETFSNLTEHFGKVLGIVGEAWDNVFGDVDFGQMFYKAIEKIYEFTEALDISEEQAKNFKDILTGIFSAFDLSWSLASASLMGGLKILNEVLKLFGTDLGSVLGFVANQVTKLNQWVEGIAFFGSTTKWEDFGKAIHAVLSGIRDCIAAFFELERFKGVVEKVKGLLSDLFNFDTNINFLGIDFIVQKINDFFDKIESWIRGMDSAENLGLYIIEGLYKGILSGTQMVIGAIVKVATAIFEAICGFFGIHSPSRLMMMVGAFLIMGLINGIRNAEGGLIDIITQVSSTMVTTVMGIIQNGFPQIVELVKSLGPQLVQIIKDIDLGIILSSAVSGGMFVLATKWIKVMDKFATPFEGFGKLAKSVGGFIDDIGDSIKKHFKARLIDKIGNAVLNMAISIAILAGALFLISKINPVNLWESVAAIGVLAGIVAALAGVTAIIDKFSKTSKNGVKLNFMLVTMAASILILAIALKQISSIEDVGKSIGILTGMLLGLTAFIAVLSKLTRAKVATNIHKAGTMLLELSLALLVMTFVIKQIGKLESMDIVKGLVVIGVLELFFMALTECSGKSGEHAAKAGKMIMKMSIALLLIVGVIKLISFLSPEEIIKGLTVIGLIGTLFYAFIKVSEKSGEHAGKAGWMFVGMAAALLAVVFSIKQIADISVKDLIKGLTVVTIIGALFGGLIWVSGYSGMDAHKAGVMLLEMAGALLIITGAIFLLSNIKDTKGLWNAVGVVSILMILMGGLIYVSTFAGDANKILVTTGVIVLLLSGVLIALTYLASTKGDALKNATISLTALIGVFAVLIFAMQFLKTGEKAYARNLATLGGLALIITYLTGIVAALSEIPNPERAIPAAAAIGVLLLSMSGAMTILSQSKNMKPDKIKGMIQALVAMGLVIAEIALILGVMSLIPNPMNTIPTAIAMGILLEAMAGAMAILSKFVTKVANLDNIMNAMLKLGVVVWEIGLILTVLSLVENPIGLIPTAIAMGILLEAMAGAMAILSNFVTKTAKLDVIVHSLILMGAVIAEIGVILLILSAIPNPVGLIPTATAIGLLLEAMSFAMMILSNGVTKTAKLNSIMGSMMLLGLVVGELAVILGLMSKFDAHAAIGDAIALSVLLGAMTGVLIILGATAAFTSLAWGGIGALAALTVVVGLVAVIIGELSTYDPKGCLQIAEGLSLLLIALSASLLILSFVGTLAVPALIGIGVLAVFIATMATLLHDIGELTKLPGYKEVMNGGLEILAIIGQAIGKFIGSIITGFVDGVIDIIPKFGECLSGFMKNLSGFIDGAKQIDDTFLEGIVKLSAGILLLSGASFISGILSLGGINLISLGFELTGFMMAAQGFFDGIRDIDPTVMEGVKTLSEAIIILTAANLLDGITRFLGFGGNSLSDFGSGLSELGTQISGFATNLGTFTQDQVTTVTCACDAIKALATAAKELPNDGGIWGVICGNNSLATFGSNLAYLGKYISGFVENLTANGTFDDSTVKTVQCAGDAIVALATAAKELPNDGGWLGAIFGENSLATFSGNLPGLGSNIASFITNLGTFTEDQVTTVKCAGDAIVALAKAAGTLPNDGGWVGKIFGENSLAAFGDQLPGFATDIKGFVDGLGTIGEDGVVAVTNGVKVIKALADLGGVNITATATGLGTFGNKLSGFATKISEFVSKIGEVGTDKITSAINKVKELITFAQSTAQINLKSLSTFTDSLVEVSTNGMTAFVNTFTNNDIVSDVKNAAQNVLANFVDGLAEKEDTVNKKFTAIAEAGVGKLSAVSITDSAKSAGKAVVQGFADGITLNKYISNQAAKEMAKAAAQAAKDALDINSPSRVFRAIAYSIPEGFAMGIDKMSYLASDSATAMANKTIGGVKNAISRISDYVDGNIDSQPTIRPVMDLSDVKTGINAISGMFGSTQTVGVMANVNSISSMMNQRNQNGANGDIISELGKLRNALGNIGQGNTYNINGINYNDDTAVSDAISTLVRATLIEGRA